VTAGFDLRGRRALVTGGTRGLGRAIVVALASAGADVVTCHRGAGEDAASLARELKETGGDHHVVRADVCREEDVAQLVDVCRSAFGSLDILVNNVGADGLVPFAELTLDGWRQAVDANLTTAFLVTRAALPLLSAGASVVNVGARSATHGVPGGAHHAAAKAGLAGLTRSLARELGPEGIRVNLVAPGPMTDHSGLRAADVASVVAFLASDDAGFVTGETVPVDGGTP